MKKLMVMLVSVSMLLALTVVQSAAFSWPDTGPIGLDLDGFTSLYDDGVAVAPGSAPVVGYTTQAVFNFNQVYSTVGYGGGDLPASWVGGVTDGTYLYAVEKNLEISNVVVGTNSIHYAFDRIDNPVGYDFELYESTLPYYTADTTDVDFLSTVQDNGPNNIAAIMADIGGTMILRANVALSTFNDPLLGFGVEHAFAVSNELTNDTGTFLDQATSPFGLDVNFFLDVDETFGLGAQVIQGLYGTGPDGSQYDVAIQGMDLGSEDNSLWVVVDDEVRVGVVPEPSTFILLGLGLIGTALFGRKRFAGKR